MSARNQSVKEFLLSAGVAWQKAKESEEKILFLTDAANHITTTLSLAPGGGGDVHKDGVMIQLADRMAELREQEQEYLRRVSLVSAFIDLLPTTAHRVLLHLRYVEMLPWSKVRARLPEYKIFYEQRQVYRLHGEALAAARAKWAELGLTENTGG